MANNRKRFHHDTVRHSSQRGFSARLLMRELAGSSESVPEWPAEDHVAPILQDTQQCDYYIGRLVLGSEKTVATVRNYLGAEDELFVHDEQLVLPLMRRHDFSGLDGHRTIYDVLSQLHKTQPGSNQEKQTIKTGMNVYAPSKRPGATVIGVRIRDDQKLSSALGQESRFIEDAAALKPYSGAFRGKDSLTIRAVESRQRRPATETIRGIINRNIKNGSTLVLSAAQVCEAPPKQSE